MIEIFTDGCAKGNPGVGGYGAILKVGKLLTLEFSGGFRYTTNNRMELLGVIIALENLKDDTRQKVLVTTDSKYVVDSVTKGWVFSWEKHYNFQSKKNRDLWLRFLEVYRKHEVEFEWVRGHSGHTENERCDELANLAIKGDLSIDEGYEKNTGYQITLI